MTAKIFILILFAFIIALAISYFQNLYNNSHRYKYHYLLFALRTISLFMILLLLINPKIKHRTLEISKPILSILVDNSSSIKYSKQNSLINTIFNKIKTNQEIQDKFNVNYYGFGKNIEIQDKFDFTKEQTDIYNTLFDIDKLYKNEKATTILISDGNQNYGKNYLFYQPKHKVFPIIIGDTTKHTDLRISNLNVNAYSYLGNQFPIEVFIQYQGDKTIQPILKIYSKNKVVYSKKLQLSQENNSKHLNFKLPALAKGKHFYKAVISSIKNEKNTKNNIFNFSVEVLNEKTNILLVYDILHPDIAFWKRSIESNKQRKLSITSILDFNQKLSDYNFIILYQPNTTFKNILKQIQDQKINFIIQTGMYTDWDFLNKNQVFFSKIHSQKTEDITPIFNEDFSTFQIKNIDFKDLPPLKNNFGKINIKVPFESLLFQGIKNIETKNPLLVTFKQNNHKGIVLFGENIYKWRTYSYTLNNSFKTIDNFSNSLFQYLQSNKNKKRLNITYQPFYYSNEDINITAQFYDANYNFDKNAELEIEFFSNSTNKKVHPLLLKENSFKTNLKNLLPGVYNFNVFTTDKMHRQKGEFTVLEFSIEQQNLYANKEGLITVAKKSNGEFFYPDQTEKLIDYLINSSDFPSIQKEQIKTNSLINWKWLLALIILSLVAEWFVRKYNGLI